MEFFIELDDCNQGCSAGKLSGMYNLGVDDAPREISPNNILDFLLELKGTSEEDRTAEVVDIKQYILRVETDVNGRRTVAMGCVKSVAG